MFSSFTTAFSGSMFNSRLAQAQVHVHLFHNSKTNIILKTNTARSLISFASGMDSGVT